MKRNATVLAAGALALFAGSLVMLVASDQAAAAFRGGGGHAVGGGQTMSRSVGRPTTRAVSARHTPTVSRRVSTATTRTGQTKRVSSTSRTKTSSVHKPGIGKAVSSGSLAHAPGTQVNVGNPNTGTKVSVGNTGKGPGGITQGPGNHRPTTLAQGPGGAGKGGTGLGKGIGPGKPPPGGFRPANVNITIINHRFVNAFRGPRQIYWGGAWVSLAALSVIPAVYVGGLQYDPYGYVALAEPACSGITPEGYRLTWRDVPTDVGGTILQCVAYYPRGRAAPVVAAGAVPGQAVNAAATSAMAQGCLVEIFSQASFTGTSSDIAADQPRLSDYGWDKQISSLHVKSGTWDFYSEPDYGGQMVRLLAGQYLGLEGWDKQISSFMCTQPK